jgi:hypothetical protein
MAAYQGFLAGQKSAPSPRNGEGTFGRLINEYYGSRPFLNLKPSSRRSYRYVLEPLAKAHGHRLVRDMRADKIAKIIQDIGETKPGMANLTKSVLQKMMKYAVKMKWRADNPVLGIEPFRRGTHHTWTEGELKAFETRWPLGTRQRLAYARQESANCRVLTRMADLTFDQRLTIVSTIKPDENHVGRAEASGQS